jgi:bacterioferritin
MKKDTPDARVIEILNDVLTAELTAVNQYFVHAEMCQNWGYERLYHRIREEAMDEMRHAESLIERVLFLGGVPNVQRLGKITIGETVPEQLSLDLTVERDAVGRLNSGLEVCRESGDNGSRILLEKILHDEEEHVDWIESQLELIEQVGDGNYLAQQIRKQE